MVILFKGHQVEVFLLLFFGGWGVGQDPFPETHNGISYVCM